MKRAIFFILLFCFMASFSFAQSEEEIKEEVKIDMEKLHKEMETMRQDLQKNLEEIKVNLQDMDIDLSALDQLKDIDWEKQLNDEEAIAYLNSDEFRQEMERAREEVNKAMEEVREEMANIDMTEVNKAIEEAMQEVERELSNRGKEE